MTYGNRGFIAASIFGLITFTGFLTASFTEAALTNYNEEIPTAAVQRYGAMLAAGGATANYAPYPVINASSCYSSANHDSADLCAQWRAALAAERASQFSYWGNWIAVLSAILSFISIVLVLRALRQTQDAHVLARAEFEAAREDARRSADIAATANRIANDAMLDSGRPWVFLNNISNNLRSWRDGREIFTWNFSVVNYGEGLAVVDNVEAALCFSDIFPTDNANAVDGKLHGISLNEIRHRINFKNVLDQSTILRTNEGITYEETSGPSMATNNIPPNLLALRQRIRLFISPAAPEWLSFWLIGTIYYRDARNRKLETGFCYRLTFQGFGKITEEGGIEHNYRV